MAPYVAVICKAGKGERGGRAVHGRREKISLCRATSQNYCFVLRILGRIDTKTVVTLADRVKKSSRWCQMTAMTVRIFFHKREIKRCCYVNRGSFYSVTSKTGRSGYGHLHPSQPVYYLSFQSSLLPFCLRPFHTKVAGCADREQ